MEGTVGGHRLRTATATFAMVGLVLASAGCGSSLFATSTGTSAPSTTATTTTTVPTVNGVAVGIPVVSCTAAGSSSYSDGSGGGWRPSFMLAPIPTAFVSQLEFYSDGTHTVLAPASWTCSTLTPSDQEAELVVYPPNDPDPPISGLPAAGTQAIFAFFDTTDQPQGVSLVCPFFTVPTWQEREAQCFSGHTPSGEQTTMPTPDVAAVTDPDGVTGSLPGSGGPHTVYGVVIFPQVMPAVQDGEGIDVAEESCSLSPPTLCPTILSDFEVREFPVPSG
jgi:hypothetical protein